MKFDFGLVGLGVMGRNFILNVAENGFSSLGLSSKIDSINLLKEEGKNYKVDGTQSDEDFVNRLSSPRISYKSQLISVIELLLKYSLHLEKGLDPKKPLFADKGEG